MKFQEYQLADFATCPLMQMDTYLTAVESASRKLTQWVLGEAMNGRIVPAYVMRLKFVKFWNDDWGNKPHDGQEDWDGPRRARQVAATLFKFITAYEVLRPIQPYTFSLGEDLVEGHYALVRKRSRLEKHDPLILIIHMGRPRNNSLPDVLELVRFCNEMRGCEWMNVGFYHLSLFTHRSWIIKSLDEPLALRWLASILEAVRKGGVYPSPGAHCSTCQGKACMKVRSE